MELTRSIFFLVSLVTYQIIIVSGQNPEASGLFRCPNSSVAVYPASKQACSKSYYLCVNYVAILQKCPGKAVFDASSGKCIIEASCVNNTVTMEGAEITTLSTTKATPSSNTSTTKSQVSFNTEKQFECLADGNYRNPDDCHKFYTCSNGNVYVFDCPADLVYNPTQNLCDWRENVPGC